MFNISKAAIGYVPAAITGVVKTNYSSKFIRIKLFRYLFSLPLFCNCSLDSCCLD